MTLTTLFDVESLRAAVASGHLLLTPNRRLASRIRTALVVAARVDAAEGAVQRGLESTKRGPESTKSAEGRATVVRTPYVLALSDWLERSWQELVFRLTKNDDENVATGRWVLNADQERVLWEQVIRASPVGAALLRPAQAAELAASALRSIVLWRQWPLSHAQRGYFSDTDTTCFLDWLAEFEAACREQGCITQPERDLHVADALIAGRLPLSQPISLVCFDELAPLHAELFATIGAQPISIPARNQSAQRVACDSYEQQIRAGMRWIRQQLATNSAGPFALVVPDLSSQRQRVERILLDEMQAAHVLPASPRQLPAVNFSAGQPLADTPVMQSALRLLSLLLPDITRADLLTLLHSPFMVASEANATAMAVTAVCDLLTDSISGAQLRGVTALVAERFEGWAFDRALQQLADNSRRGHLSHLRAPLSVWADHFRHTLALLGWPGARTLDSVEYQQVSQWQELLAELSAFDDISGNLSLAGALTALRQLAAARVFQAETVDAPIQVLGLLEAAGLQFEGLWLCDMADDQWPPAASPHPLLPRDWQRRLRMPHCDAEREYSVARQLSISLRANTRALIVSYQRERDDVERRVSPLFQDLPDVELSALNIVLAEPFKPAIPLAQVMSAAGLENFDPGSAPPLDLSVRARGGSALLADQAACPFRAFARHRLRAEPLGEPQTGLSASERGVLLHTALQSLWQPLQTSAALRACSETELAQRAAAAAAFALRELPDIQRFGARFIALETQRLRRVLLRWIELEQERADVEIAALEEERRFNFAGLDLRLRVDRIDRLPDGRVAILDYKSGQSNSINAWLGERPEQPQLPLYALALEHEQPGSVAGVMFAQVRLDTPRWIGLGDDQLETYGLKPVNDEVPDWPTRLQAWQSSLQTLANEFIQGRADVDPASPKSCQYCALPSVCRIDHAQLDAAAEEAVSES